MQPMFYQLKVALACSNFAGVMNVKARWNFAEL